MTVPVAGFYQPRTSPYAHQRAVLERSWSRAHWGLLLEMGTGKSKILIDTICMLREQRGLERAIVIAPKGTYANWFLKEIPTHMPDRHRDTCIAHMWTGGHTAREKLALDRMSRAPVGTLRILIINIEALTGSPRAWAVAQQFVRGKKCLIAVDESSTIKNPDAKRTKKVHDLAGSCEWRRIATGTPVTRSPLDLWAQFETLRSACLGWRSFFAFRNRFAILEDKTIGGGTDWNTGEERKERTIHLVVGHRDTDLLSKIVSDHATVLRKEDCLDLPPKIFETADVYLTDAQIRMYEEMRELMTTELGDGNFASAQVVITKLLRLHQICCGHLVDEMGTLHQLPTNRLDVLEDVLAEASTPAIIWCTYRNDIERVCERVRKMGLRAVEYHGGTSQPDRADSVYRFQGERMVDGQVERCPDHMLADLFVGTQSAGGYGLTLTRARTVIYYSNNYDLEKRLQSEDRAHRIGQNFPVTYVDLVARGTIDERIIEVLRRKQSLANLIMDGPARLRELLGERPPSAP